MQIKIYNNSDTPIYQQIVNSIKDDVSTGKLPAGTKLPTFRVLSDELGVSLGTIKRAYDDLYHQGIITMTQGRGSFIAEATEHPTSRKDYAVELIDKTIDELLKLPMSAQEIKIFFDLKLREKQEEQEYIKVAIIDCSIEAAIMIQGKLSVVPNLDISLYLLSDYLANPSIIQNDIDLYLTTFTHLEDVVKSNIDKSRLMGIAMATSTNTVIELSKLEKDTKTAIVTKSETFARVIERNLKKFSNIQREVQTVYIDDSYFENHISKYDCLIVANSFYRIASRKEIEVVAKAEKNNQKVIWYDYEIDKGSFIYLKDKISEIQSKKIG